MKRVASHFTFCSPSKILKKAVVEQDDLLNVTRIFSLNEGSVESAHTHFFDGIISAEIISIKQNINPENIANLVDGFYYLDLSDENFIIEILNQAKPLLIDFGRNSLEEINLKLKKLAIELSSITVFDLIAACVYYPAVLIGKEAELKLNSQTNLVIWENVNLPDMRLTTKSKVRKI